MRVLPREGENKVKDWLWEAGPCTGNGVATRPPDELAYTTVLTMLRKLEAKRYVGHTEAGRAHRYHALVDRAAAQEGAIRTLIGRLFKGSTEALLLHLVEREKLSAAQVKRIEEQLQKASRKEKP